MDIWLIQIGEPIPVRKGVRKQRLALLSEALAKSGHQVTRWGSTFDHITKTMLYQRDTDIKLIDNYTVKLIKGCGYEKNVSFRRFFDHALIESRLLRIANKMKRPDLILVATPPHGLAYKIVKFSKKNNIPVIVDIRDQWPDTFIERLPVKFQKFCVFLLSYEFFKLNSAIQNANSVTAMMDDLLTWGLQKAKRSRTTHDKIFYIGTDPVDPVNPSGLSPWLQEVFSNLKGKKVFTFIGTFSNFQHPLIIIEVAKIFKKEKRNDIVFLIGGSGDYFEKAKVQARNLDNVILLGWLQHDEIMAILHISDVGICPLNAHRPFFPNKAFLYLSASMPIIASTPGELEHLIKKHQLGLYFEPNDIEGLYKSVLVLADSSKQSEMRQNVENVFERLFDANIIYQKFSKYIETIANVNCEVNRDNVRK